MNLIEDRLREEQVRFLCQPAARVSTSTSMARTVDLLREDSGGCVIITDASGDASHSEASEDASANGRPIGIFTERDYLDKIITMDAAEWDVAKDRAVESFMTAKPHTLSVNDPLAELIRLMTRRGYRHLPIVDDSGFLHGVVSAHDIIMYLAEFFPAEIYNLPPKTNQDQKFDRREGE